MATLGDLVDIRGGGTPSRKTKEYWGGNIPWVTVKDFKSTRILGAQESITQSGVDNSATNLIPAGNIIVPTRMALGKAAINDVDVAINQDLKALLIKNAKEIHTQYLLRYLETKAEWIERQGKGATVKGITVDVLKNLSIPLPPLPIQKQIATLLEKADTLRSQCKHMEQELNQLAQSVFLEMFGDPVTNPKYVGMTNLGDIVDIKGALVSPELPEYQDLNHVGPEHIEKETGRLLPLKTAKEEGLISGKYLFDEHCVIYSKIRPYLKKATIPGFRGLCSADMYPLTPKENVATKEFLWALLLSSSFDRYIDTLPSRANIPKLNRKELNGFSFNLPPYHVQEKFSSVLDAINDKKMDLVHYSESVAQLFNSLMQNAFNGKLDLTKAA
ncbi:MAG: restriction endonuclease subunit S [Candidatus Thiodiazotropha endolucinida]